MYGLMVAFEPTRATAVYEGQNKGMNLGNILDEPGTGRGAGIMALVLLQLERLSVGTVGGTI